MCSNDAVHILEIIEYIALFYICIIDIRKKIIPDRGFIILVIIGLLKGMINTNIEGYFLGMCVYPMPLIILYILEDYFKKSYAPILKDKPNIQPIALKVKGDIFSNNDEESLFFALTYYDKDAEEILEGHTKYIKAKSIDVNLKDAFGDKDMLVLK